MNKTEKKRHNMSNMSNSFNRNKMHASLKNINANNDLELFGAKDINHSNNQITSKNN